MNSSTSFHSPLSLTRSNLVIYYVKLKLMWVLSSFWRFYIILMNSYFPWLVTFSRRTILFCRYLDMYLQNST